MKAIFTQIKDGHKYATYKCNNGRYQVTVDDAECGHIQREHCLGRHCQELSNSFVYYGYNANGTWNYKKHRYEFPLDRQIANGYTLKECFNLFVKNFKY
jgi:hypothetical protein